MKKGVSVSNLILLDTPHPKDLIQGLDDELKILIYLTQSVRDKFSLVTISHSLKKFSSKS